MVTALVGRCCSHCNGCCLQSGVSSQGVLIKSFSTGKWDESICWFKIYWIVIKWHDCFWWSRPDWNQCPGNKLICATWPTSRNINLSLKRNHKIKRNLNDITARNGKHRNLDMRWNKPILTPRLFQIALQITFFFPRVHLWWTWASTCCSAVFDCGV